MRRLLLTLLLLLSPALARAGNARLLTTDAAEVLDRPVLGLQRSALPLPLGLAVDTSLLADALLLANLGLRWGKEVGPHRFVVGARYTQFLGSQVYSDAIREQAPVVRRFDATLSGPSAYALYGLSPAEGWLLQVEGRWWGYPFPSAVVMAGANIPLGAGMAIAAELGAQLPLRDAAGQVVGRPGLRGAAGLRFVGEHLGLTLGAAFVDIVEPMLPGGSLPVVPVFDLSWTF
jgi:hypothetical protein